MHLMKREISYLIADAEHPLVCTDKLRDELLLYNIPTHSLAQMFTQFKQLCNKDLDESSSLQELSGGQKVILMALLAIHSPAPRIRFINLKRYLDPHNSAALQELIYSGAKEIIEEVLL
ncbi:MAG TPA: hypothetical protein DHW79_03115 [Candidatus Cloacimonas sp.]|nr:hypothetical protein [Candidatus Cloacimonadota bacterium]HCM14934.1 hypothetical protein [Candidatus Cloacimonas sp.]